MTRERTVTLREAREELDTRLDELAEEYREANAGSDYAEVIERRATDVEQQLAGVAHLIDEYGSDATVRVAGLTAEDYASVQDHAAAIRQSRGIDHIPGTGKHVYAATGLCDAPFLGEAADQPGEDGLDATLRALGEQPPEVARWLYAEVDSLTGGDGDFRTFAERLQATQDTET